MLSVLEPYTIYVNEEENKDIQMLMSMTSISKMTISRISFHSPRGRSLITTAVPELFSTD